VVCLIKPQFELSNAEVGKEAWAGVVEHAEGQGEAVVSGSNSQFTDEPLSDPSRFRIKSVQGPSQNKGGLLLIQSTREPISVQTCCGPDQPIQLVPCGIPRKPTSC
jgi:predicted rRNA methylase YqxC with S4 and FtsJ domains